MFVIRKARSDLFIALGGYERPLNVAKRFDDLSSAEAEAASLNRVPKWPNVLDYVVQTLDEARQPRS